MAMSSHPGPMGDHEALSARERSHLVLIGALLPVSRWAILGTVTTLVAVSWVLLAAIDKSRSG